MENMTSHSNDIDEMVLIYYNLMEKNIGAHPNTIGNNSIDYTTSTLKNQNDHPYNYSQFTTGIYDPNWHGWSFFISDCCVIGPHIFIPIRKY